MNVGGFVDGNDSVIHSGKWISLTSLDTFYISDTLTCAKLGTWRLLSFVLGRRISGSMLTAIKRQRMSGQSLGYTCL